MKSPITEHCGQLVLATLAALTASHAHADLRALYDFTPDGVVSTDPVVAAYSEDRIAGEPDLPLLAMINGAEFGDANLLGPSTTGDRLESAGLVSEPPEPTDQDNHFGFWINEEVLRPLDNWTLLMWFNRRDAENHDFLFYVGSGDGFGGTGAETYVYAHPDGSLIAENRATNSIVDMQISGGTVVPGQWSQLGLVRSGSEMQLYLDGVLLGSDSSVALNSFEDPSNSVIVLGAAKWLRLANMRQRVFDGLIDQVEIYDESLSRAAIVNRYDAFAGPVVPEPATITIAVCFACTCAVFLRRT